MQDYTSGFMRTNSGLTVLNSIREKIILQEYKANSMITETQLSKEYNISRGTIRTVMQELTNEGLLVTLQNGRKQVANIKNDFIHNLYSIRELLEIKAVEEIIRKDNVGFSDLALVLEQFHSIHASSSDDLENERTVVNSKFHRTIFVMTGNLPLLQCWITIEPIIDSLARLNSVYLGSKKHQQDYIETHETIFKLLLTKDPSIIEYIKYHVESAKNDTLTGFSKMGVSF